MPRRPSLFDAPPRQRAPRPHSLLWIFEPLAADPGYEQRRMFGCEAAYLDGNLCLAVADRGEPWDGLLVCTAHVHHPALMAELPALQPHPVLGKWLYVPQGHEAFEATAARLAECVRQRDPRIGIPPRARGPRKRPDRGA
ncbi:hypothetical protein CEG14_01520 [Bordetella genomosp. 1]|uniref:MmcQ/YjbR family DNA-binding protein n=1 Tax=Bordetella genomosp. 1 TaxID=1395607 RepID=A0A261SSW2_9BORD|nr:hypothetical protein [Bordetella genomosp. 1]OZI40474.1 hypothetical protein CEG14_01520 [Bordetella genomosp. 1]OZI68667.1 hypothetical protein CAL27_04160 [Bordetella genomosp. 1]